MGRHAPGTSSHPGDPGPYPDLGPSSDPVPRAEPRGILVQMRGAGEFDPPLPWTGIPFQKSPLPFHLTPFDPRSEISQRKPSHPPPVPAASHFQPRVRCGHSACHHRSFPEHAPNESRTRPPEKHLKTFPKKWVDRSPPTLSILLYPFIAIHHLRLYRERPDSASSLC